MASRCTLRLAKEYHHLNTTSDLSLAVSANQDNLREMRTMIIGPPSTPYQFGFFEFDFNFPDNYPDLAPKVHALTTDRGRTRFNPNIYANGKVCLSILGTWSGAPGEQWSACQNLETTLISIQSLMCSNPYQNEPGFDKTGSKDKKAIAYADKITHETLRISVIMRLEKVMGITPDGGASTSCRVYPEEQSDDSDGEYKAPIYSKKAKAANGTAIPKAIVAPSTPFEADKSPPDPKDQPDDPFADLCKIRFLWYYESYLDTIAAQEDKHVHGKRFTKADFESGSNSMNGSYVYRDLLQRLKNVRKVIDDETTSWAQMSQDKTGPIVTTRGLLLGAFDQVSNKSRNGSLDTRFEVTLEKGNPLVWSLTLFGKPSTNLDGAIVAMKMHFPSDFPDTQPRVMVKTPLFHHRISKTGGVLCYIAQDTASVISHIVGIFEALEDEEPRYDPRMIINKEAADLLYGTEQEKKLYARRLRRSVQDSLENF